MGRFALWLGLGVMTVVCAAPAVHAAHPAFVTLLLTRGGNTRVHGDDASRRAERRGIGLGADGYRGAASGGCHTETVRAPLDHDSTLRLLAPDEPAHRAFLGAVVCLTQRMRGNPAVDQRALTGRTQHPSTQHTTV